MILVGSDPRPIGASEAELHPILGFYIWYNQEATIEKAASHKYLRRVPYTDGKGRKRFRYFYNVGGGAGVGHHDEMQVGAKFKLEHGGHLGHFEVTKDLGNGYVVIRHDETGHSFPVTREFLASHIKAHYQEQIDDHRAKKASDALSAVENGNEKLISLRIDELKKTNVSPSLIASLEKMAARNRTVASQKEQAEAGQRHPSDTSPDTVGPLKLGMSLDEAEDAIRMEAHEHLMAVLPDGRHLIRKTSGAPDHVLISEADRDVLIAAGNAIVTHNHPGGSVLSYHDFTLAIMFNLAEMRATTPEGGTWSIKRPDDGWGVEPEQHDSFVSAMKMLAQRALWQSNTEMTAHLKKNGRYPPGKLTASEEAEWDEISNKNSENMINKWLGQSGYSWRMQYESPEQRRARVSGVSGGVGQGDGAGEVQPGPGEGDASGTSADPGDAQGGSGDRLSLLKEAEAATKAHVQDMKDLMSGSVTAEGWKQAFERFARSEKAIKESLLAMPRTKLSKLAGMDKDVKSVTKERYASMAFERMANRYNISGKGVVVRNGDYIGAVRQLVHLTSAKHIEIVSAAAATA